MRHEENRKGFDERVFRIDWPFNAPQPALKCPITGEVISSGFEDQDAVEAGDPQEEVDYASISTVLFAFLGDISEFLYLRSDLREMLEKARQEKTNDPGMEGYDDFELLKQEFHRLDENIVVFELNTGGMACGPVWSTLWVGLDLLAPFREE